MRKERLIDSWLVKDNKITKVLIEEPVVHRVAWEIREALSQGRDIIPEVELEEGVREFDDIWVAEHLE